MCIRDRLTPIYAALPGISKLKKEDLLSLFKIKEILNAYHWFFEDLKINQSVPSEGQQELFSLNIN